MLKFLKNSISFLIIALLVGELVVRITHSVSDIPKRQIDADNIQKYLPNQKGYWKGGDHQWIINELGWPGILPDDYDNLITVIGDSFIENFMNPNECHQAIFLKEQNPNYNFFETGRSGISFIEAMEISKKLQYSRKPKLQLVYVTDSDFTESIREIEVRPDITQLWIENKKVINGKIKSAKSKTILYNWKLMYYFYNTISLPKLPFSSKQIATADPDNESRLKSENKKYENIAKLLEYVRSNYDLNNIVLVFHPNSDPKIIESSMVKGFNLITLHSKEEPSWTFDYDKHWTCFGHKRVSEQITDALIQNEYYLK